MPSVGTHAPFAAGCSIELHYTYQVHLVALLQAVTRGEHTDVLVTKYAPVFKPSLVKLCSPPNFGFNQTAAYATDQTF